MKGMATRFLDAVDAYKAMHDPANAVQMIHGLPEDQFRVLIQSSAVLFSMLKEEAIRRGIFEDLLTPMAEAINESRRKQ